MSFLIYWALGYVAGRCDARQDTATQMRSSGGKARALKLTDQERSDSARLAVIARWDRVRAARAAAVLKAKKRKRGVGGLTARLS